jgi:hypothetical protein
MVTRPRRLAGISRTTPFGWPLSPHPVLRRLGPSPVNRWRARTKRQGQGIRTTKMFVLTSTKDVVHNPRHGQTPG